MNIQVGDMLVDENGKVVGTVVRVRKDGKLRLRIPPRREPDMDLGPTEAITRKRWKDLNYKKVDRSDWRERMRFVLETGE